MSINKPCHIVVDFMEELFAESATKMALFIAWTFGHSSETLKKLKHLRYDRACSMVPHVRNMLDEHSKRPFLPECFIQVWTEKLLDNVCLDVMHCQRHARAVCNIEKAADVDQVLYDPRIAKFGCYSGIDDQVVEQEWSVWEGLLASITRHSTQHKSFWYIYVYKETRNEWMEGKMKDKNLLLKSGIPQFGGFLRANWQA